MEHDEEVRTLQRWYTSVNAEVEESSCDCPTFYGKYVLIYSGRSMSWTCFVRYLKDQDVLTKQLNKVGEQSSRE